MRFIESIYIDTDFNRAPPRLVAYLHNRNQSTDGAKKRAKEKHLKNYVALVQNNLLPFLCFSWGAGHAESE